jgi:hypothetical protein
MNETFQVVLALRFDTSWVTKVVLEPWGEEFLCGAGDMFRFEASGPQSSHRPGFELVISADRCVVTCDWTRNTVLVSRNGIELDSASKIVPTP